MTILAENKDPAMGNLGYERIEGDYYPTPPWCTEALLRNFDFGEDTRVWEPACGEGHMAKVISKRYDVVATDLYDRGYGKTGIDFLNSECLPEGADVIITNPPYLLAEEFITHALELTRPVGGCVAMLLRNEYDCASSREYLFKDPSFSMKLVLTKRPKWIAGSTGSPRHNYAWFVWDTSQEDCEPTIYWDQ